MKHKYYLNMGYDYASRSNYFNAFKAYQASFEVDGHPLKTLNNMGALYKKMGLERKALQKFSKVTQLIEEGQNEDGFEPFKSYLNRTELFLIQGKRNKTLCDLQTAHSLLLQNQFGAFSLYSPELYLVFAKDAILYGDFEKGLDYLSKRLQYSMPQENSLMLRGFIYSLLRVYDKALSDYKQAALNNINAIYYVGKMYYMLGDFENAKENYCLFTEKYSKANLNTAYPYYDTPQYKHGIVQYINYEKKYGFIFGSTWYSQFDSIYFKFKDCIKVPKLNERVKFDIEYTMYLNKFEPKAIKIEPSSMCVSINNNKQINISRTFHAIAHLKSNAFRQMFNFQYLQVFFPLSFNYPLLGDFIDKLPSHLLEKKEQNDYLFLEITINFDSLGVPNFESVDSIKINNKYADSKIIGANRYKQKQNDFFNQESCSICGMFSWCGRDACPLDPT